MKSFTRKSEDNLSTLYLKNLKGYGLLKRSYPFKFFKECLPQISLGLLLHTLSCLLIYFINVPCIFAPAPKILQALAKSSFKKTIGNTSA